MKEAKEMHLVDAETLRRENEIALTAGEQSQDNKIK